MATPIGPIALLTEEALRFVPEGPLFEQIVAEELGAEGTPADGFDATIAEAAAPLAQADTVLAALAGEEAEAAEVAPLFQREEEAELAAEIEPAGQAADQALDEFEQIIAPTPEEGGDGSGTTEPTPTSGATGGSIGGGLTVDAPYMPIGYEGEPLPTWLT
jgi:hypothetical protein